MNKYSEPESGISFTDLKGSTSESFGGKKGDPELTHCGGLPKELVFEKTDGGLLFPERGLSSRSGEEGETFRQ